MGETKYDEIREREIFSQRLNYYMNLNSITKLQLAEIMDVSPSTVTSWTKGEKLPRMGKIQALADLFHVQKSDLVNLYGGEQLELVKDELFEKRKLLFDISNRASSEALDEIIQIVNNIVERGPGADAYVRRVDMPMSVRGFTIKDEEGLYNIYINNELSPEAEMKTLQHEVEHIVNGDFEKDETGHILD